MPIVPIHGLYGLGDCDPAELAEGLCTQADFSVTTTLPNETTSNLSTYFDQWGNIAPPPNFTPAQLIAQAALTNSQRPAGGIVVAPTVNLNPTAQLPNSLKSAVTQITDLASRHLPAILITLAIMFTATQLGGGPGGFVDAPKRRRR